MLIGIAKGEEGRCGEAMEKWMRETVERVYPLIDLGLDRQGCQDYIASSTSRCRRRPTACSARS
jgi:hypothetical protein